MLMNRSNQIYLTKGPKGHYSKYHQFN